MAYNNIGEDAQMIAQIQDFPKVEMKASLLESFFKTMMNKTQNSSQEQIGEASSSKKLMFVDAYFERNMKSFIKHNRNEKL